MISSAYRAVRRAPNKSGTVSPGSFPGLFLRSTISLMHYARVYGAQCSALTPNLVSVETDLSRGLHSFTLVGLPDKAVEESRDRVAAAIKHAGFESPKSRNQKITISLAPADIKKEGPLFDLPIALS